MQQFLKLTVTTSYLDGTNYTLNSASRLIDYLAHRDYGDDIRDLIDITAEITDEDPRLIFPEEGIDANDLLNLLSDRNRSNFINHEASFMCMDHQAPYHLFTGMIELVRDVVTVIPNWEMGYNHHAGEYIVYDATAPENAHLISYCKSKFVKQGAV